MSGRDELLRHFDRIEVVSWLSLRDRPRSAESDHSLLSLRASSATAPGANEAFCQRKRQFVVRSRPPEAGRRFAFTRTTHRHLRKAVEMSYMLGMLRAITRTRLLIVIVATVTSGVFIPSPASAQQSDDWKVSFAPLYLWATRLNGDIATRAGTVPVFMTFDDALDKLAGAFSFHVEADKNRFGIFGDLDFVRLSTQSNFTLQGPLPLTVNGDADVNQTIVEAGARYLVSPRANFAVIGGLRTFTLDNAIEFSTLNVSVTPIDANRTAVYGFAGATYRPDLSPKFSLLSRADIGGGSGLTWSALVGVEFRPKPWLGLDVGYKGLGVDFGKSTDGKTIRSVDMTLYGPIFGVNFHWGGR